jgi:hypothetical protein
MKEYRLVAWAELPAPYHRMAYRRMLTDLSHRYLSVPQLMSASGLRRHEVREFLDMLDGRSLLDERDLVASDSVLRSLRPWGGWIRKALNAQASEH